MNAILAAILSFIIAGLGQALSGDIKRGVLFFLAQILLGIIVSLIFKEWILHIFNLLFSLYVAYDAYQMNQ